MFAILSGIPAYTCSIDFMNLFIKNKMRYDDIKIIYTVDGVWHDWSSAQDVLIRKNALFVW